MKEQAQQLKPAGIDRVKSVPGHVQAPELSIAIISWNSRRLLEECLKSIYAGTQQTPFEIILVDNGSTDGSTELIEQRYPDIVLIKNPRNRGVAPARNQALEACRGKFVLILDVDTRIMPGALDKLVAFARKTPDAGIVGARLLDPDGNLQLTCRRFPSILTPILRRLDFIPFFRESRLLREQMMADWDHTHTREVDYVIGACQLIRREVIEEVGLLDERIFYGPEDIDYCLRAHANGWKIYYYPHATIMHYERRITKKLFSLITMKHFWGLFYFFQKHGYLFNAHSHYAIIMPRTMERVLLFCGDFIAIFGSYIVWSRVRGALGFYTIRDPMQLAITGLIIFLYWFLVFLFFGLYRVWHAYSRFDEVLSVFKAVIFGVLLIFVLTFDTRDFTSPVRMSRLLIITYWLLMTTMVAIGRSILRTFQRRLLESGIGLRRTLIIGWNKKARTLHDKIKRFPALGYRVVGFIDVHPVVGRQSYKGIPVVGSVSQLGELIERNKIEDLLIALNWQQRKHVMSVISQTAEKEVTLRIIPDLYGIVMGRARTNQIYGTPLIEILPQHMAPWEQKAKRMIDIIVSAAVLLIGLPLWLLVGLLIKLETPGPVFYSQERVGLRGKAFRIFKFRSMVQDAEKVSGPKWAEKGDPRVTRTGRWIRKYRLDEIPQFWNVLKGEMSLIGPRPERPYFVDKLRKELPLYTRRLRVRPGISGWAQIKGDYDASLDDVKQKLQYDIFYLENMSLRLDLKIMINTLLVIFSRRGR